MYFQGFVKTLLFSSLLKKNNIIKVSSSEFVQHVEKEYKTMMTCEYPDPVCPSGSFCMKLYGKTGVCVVMKD